MDDNVDARISQLIVCENFTYAHDNNEWTTSISFFCLSHMVCKIEFLLVTWIHGGRL